MKTSLFKLAGLLLVSTAWMLGTAQAQLYVAEGRNTDVLASFNFTIDPVLNQVTVAVDNSEAGPGGVIGKITSFGFNVPTGLAGSVTLLSQNWTSLSSGRTEPDDWSVYTPYNISIGGSGYSQDTGVITGPNAQGGSPNAGIWFGESVTFVFQLADFVSPEDFLGIDGVTARWQAVENSNGGTSDVGFGNPPQFTPVPEPSSYAMAGVLALAGITGWRKLRNRRLLVAPRA